MKSNKEVLSKRVFENHHKNLALDDVSLITSEFFNELSNSMLEGERMEIRGFGSMSIKSKTVPCDPRSNISGSSEKRECKSIHFRMSKELGQKLNS
jgi:integration host factor subunit beta